MSVTVSWQRDHIRAVIRLHKDKPGALLPVLHAIQHEIGYIPDNVVPLIAEEMRLTRAEIHGVISFYHHFRSHPTGRHVVEICRAEACQATGCRQLEQHAKNTLGIDFEQTTPCGSVTLEPVYCLGNCATGPSIRIGNQIYGRVTSDRFDALMDTCRDSMQEAG
ncbi:NAD-dependent formate dehydrogenase gamma subunit [Methylophaga frappieri]|jgi:formate dehydrogenase subunit gamma|uniref:NADH-quinone oxidoreductase subunit E n=1 Tax=Methylophaga frappieri (strain ATCC BAA-2434 / DSM 25690 / JAM7) TaxID=754477 RepID=I1YI70_METFJ|nr:formate dehydrogenase subunit gamma [Methylophaga frappieri]AFJ02613.1 NAD-dependent formate dehydrogenase gamma subunit [Methylophaga frappieri]